VSLAMEIWFRSQVTPCGFCGGKNDTGQAFEAFHQVIMQILRRYHSASSANPHLAIDKITKYDTFFAGYHRVWE